MAQHTEAELEHELAQAISRLEAALVKMSVGLELELKWLRESVDSLVRLAAEHG